MQFSDLKETARSALPQNLDRDSVLNALRLKQQSSDATDFLPSLATFGLGLAVGLALGVLLAPQSGEQTRQHLEDKARKTQRDASKKAQSAVEDLS